MLHPNYQFSYRHGVLNLAARTHIMGIVNVTPDSFSDGGRYFEPQQAIDHAFRLVAEGADILDIGGESTRPGAAPISMAEELSRIMPVIEAIRNHVTVAISVDTYKSEVAQAALEIGADIINDISGLRFDARMAETIARFNAGCVIMHIKGTPRNMQLNPMYTDVVAEIQQYLADGIRLAEGAGIDPAKIMIDPGIGFGKRFEDNIGIHQRLRELTLLDKPIVFGSSRKSFLGNILDLPADQRLEGSIASAVMAALNGAHIIRGHEVQPLKRALQTIDALKSNE